jgi:hypothetical protein
MEKRFKESDWATYQKLARKCGGKFKLCTLMQKRLQQLYRASVPGTDRSMVRVLGEIGGDVIGLKQITADYTGLEIDEGEKDKAENE